MIDIETLSTRPNALVVSIGAVRFGNELGKEFYSPCFYQQKDRDIDLGTVRWWMKQTPEAKSVFESQDALSLRETLINLKDFIEPDDQIWANGVVFDIGILENAFNQYRLKFPWKYGNLNCLRSIRRLHPGYDEVMKKIRVSTSHNALDDAKCQALALIETAESLGISLE
jgi:DNA polymerase III epsilon subunit-like protein